MGFKDRLLKKLTPDHATIFGEALGADDRLLALTSGFPSAYERKGNARGLDGAVFDLVADAVSNKAAKGRHISGDDDSIARSIPLDGKLTFVVLSQKGVSFWDLGMDGRGTPEADLLIPREWVSSIVDTGEKAQGGAIVARLSFVDGSTFDYRLVGMDEAFRQAAAGFATP